ncbi:radical SAM protein [bacterium]|nr:radical SAM protein [bacterium]MBT4292863.1 radical SAM protein [bacterium]MBT7310691.1 radical SAM protein [bacterium]
MLNVTEIYSTLLGESSSSGFLCTIIRLTGCHRRCVWCDSDYAFEGGSSQSIQEIIQTTVGQGCSTVLVTGGEPLLQSDTIELLEQLLEAGFSVLLETSGTTGTIPLSEVPAGVSRIVDIKTPDSGIDESEIDFDEIAKLGKDDELKFVCQSREDYLWSKALVESGRLPAEPVTVFSPVQDDLSARKLADWIVEDKLNVRYQIQLHKVIWPEMDRGV